MCIQKKLVKPTFMLATVLLLANCSGLKANEPEGLNADEPPSMAETTPDPSNPASTDAAPPGDPVANANSVSTSTAPESALEPTPSETPRKQHRKIVRHASKENRHPRKVSSADPVNAAEEAPVAEAPVQQPETIPAQQAQMATDPNPVATAAPTVAPIAEPAVPIATESTQTKSNDNFKYAAIGLIVVLAGYLVYRKKKQA